MKATFEVTVRGVVGEHASPASLQAAIEEALSSNNPSDIPFKVLSAQVTDEEEKIGNVGIEVEVPQVALEHKFNDDAEDEMNAHGFGKVFDAFMEQALNIFPDASFVIEDIATDSDDE